MNVATLAELIVLVVDAVVISWFLCRLNGVRPRVGYGVAYLGLSLLLSLVFYFLPADTLSIWAVQQLISLVAVCLYIHFALGAAWAPALAATSILLVCNALFSQVGALLTYLLWNTDPLLYIDLLLLAGIHLGRFAAFWLILRTMGSTFTDDGNRYLYLFLLPSTLLNLLYSDSFYTLVAGLAMGAGDTALLLRAGWTVALASACFALTLYAFAKAGQLARLQTESRLLAQEVQNQKRYIQEAGRRDEESRGLYHDMKNHLLVLAGFLAQGDTPAARGYLAKLDAAATATAPLPATGCPAVDTLLREKLMDAGRQGIKTTCQVALPQNSGIDELDLCVLFANALDNALHACAALPCGTAGVEIKALCRQRFLLLECSNTTPPGAAVVQEGTGLANIRRVAAKYNGSVDISHGEGSFRLAVLLCLPEGPG